jgi:hypothetical protein
MRSWLRRTRVRLTLTYAGLFAVLASGAAVTFWLALRNVDYGDIDAALKADARDVVSNVQDLPPGAAAGESLLVDEAPGGIRRRARAPGASDVDAGRAGERPEGRRTPER